MGLIKWSSLQEFFKHFFRLVPLGVCSSVPTCDATIRCTVPLIGNTASDWGIKMLRPMSKGFGTRRTCDFSRFSSLEPNISTNHWILNNMFTFSLENAIRYVGYISVTELKIYAIWTVQPITETKLKRRNLVIERKNSLLTFLLSYSAKNSNKQSTFFWQIKWKMKVLWNVSATNNRKIASTGKLEIFCTSRREILCAWLVDSQLFITGDKTLRMNSW